MKIFPDFHPTLATTNRIDVKFHRHFDFFKNIPESGDNVRINGGVSFAVDFRVKLRELSESPRLRIVVTKTWSKSIELYGLGPDLHAILNIGTGEAGGEFWSQGD